MTVDDVLRGAARDLLAEVRADTDAPAVLARIGTTRPRPRRGHVLAVAAALVVVLGVAAVVVTRDGDDPVTAGPPTTTSSTVAGPVPGESEGLAITVTPAEGLEDRDEVRVVVDGLLVGPGEHVELVMCAGDAMDAAPSGRGCQSPAVIELLTPTAGRIDVPFTVERIVNLGGTDGVVDCALPHPTGCAIGVTVNGRSPTGAPELVGLVGVAFTPIGDEPDPSLTVEPATGLTHGQVVTVTGEGFIGPVGGALLCGPTPETVGCTRVALGEGIGGDVPTEDGGFRVEVPIWRAFRYDDDLVDCAVVACTLSTMREDGRSTALVPLAFDATVPTPQPPTLEVSPTTGLHPGDPVTVTARGVVPGEEVLISACTLGTTGAGDECGQATSLATMVAGTDGVASITTPAADPLRYGQTCTEPGRCGVRIDSPMGSGDPLLALVEPVPVQFSL